MNRSTTLLPCSFISTANGVYTRSVSLLSFYLKVATECHVHAQSHAAQSLAMSSTGTFEAVINPSMNI